MGTQDLEEITRAYLKAVEDRDMSRCLAFFAEDASIHFQEGIFNGEEQIRFATNEMIFGVVDYLVRMTRYLTLYPGDVIWMGTEGKSPNLRDGDVVEVEISNIGTLSNPVKREAG